MKISLKTIDSLSTIQRRINVAIAKEVNVLINQKVTHIKNKVKDLAASWVMAQPEMIALSNNTLAAELGLVFGSAASSIEAIATSVQGAINVKVTKVDNKLQGGLTLEFLPSDFASLLGLTQGHTRIKDGGDLHWLRWLLLEGYKMIVVNYHFEAKAGEGRSRGGVMTKGGSWRIPPEYAGTEDDNFITRAFSGKEKEITQVIKAALS
jgi:hypothetical protein